MSQVKTAIKGLKEAAESGDGAAVVKAVGKLCECCPAEPAFATKAEATCDPLECIECCDALTACHPDKPSVTSGEDSKPKAMAAGIDPTIIVLAIQLAEKILTWFRNRNTPGGQ